MSAIARVKEYIVNTPDGQAFSSSALRCFASTENIRQILNHLYSARAEIQEH